MITAERIIERKKELSQYYIRTVEHLGRDGYNKSQNERRAKARRKKIFDSGVESYIANMTRYYTKEHRQRCYQQLKKDFQELQQHLKVA